MAALETITVTMLTYNTDLETKVKSSHERENLSQLEQSQRSRRARSLHPEARLHASFWIVVIPLCSYAQRVSVPVESGVGSRVGDFQQY